MMTKFLLALNRLFPLPVHPFNLQNEGKESYAMWQYERGANTIAFYTERYTPEEMFQDKVVLDVGCGAGGKTMYYASQGVAKIVGMDIVPHYKEEAEALAKQLGYADRFTFVVGDAAQTGFEANSFDTIIMNDAMEHVDRPDLVLAEVRRILKSGGRLYVNFPPYYHPFGAHLSDLIAIPWVHMFFSEDTLVAAYKELCKTVPDGDDRISFRISKNAQGKEYFSYINHMTVKRFDGLRAQAGLKQAYYREVPLRGFLAPFAKLPLLKECFVKMVVCVFEKE
ncbi:MAG: class I SAM-dependent methyltransferase [Butyricicoccus pullicaecorum]|nr:class I SAM-dependent methyltransferase [Butyricicoccus pullicaecorum]MDO4669539.1 class I SAM-dependent methyltransferase [Butyricicoccus pullicaecorum]